MAQIHAGLAARHSLPALAAIQLGPVLKRRPRDGGRWDRPVIGDRPDAGRVGLHHGAGRTAITIA